MPSPGALSFFFVVVHSRVLIPFFVALRDRFQSPGSFFSGWKGAEANFRPAPRDGFYGLVIEAVIPTRIGGILVHRWLW